MLIVNFATNFISLRKFWKISRTVLLLLIGLIISVWLLVQTTFIQNLLVHRAAKTISHDLNTTVRIKHVDFALFNSMLLEGTLVLDRNKDTLLYAGSVNVNITDWFFFKDKIELNYIGLQDAVIHLNRSDSVWNYRFLLDYFASPGPAKKKKNIDLNLNRVEFDNITIVQRDQWRGEDMSAFIKALNLDAREINFNKKLIRISNLDLDRPFFSLYNYDGKRPPKKTPANDEEEVIVNDPLHLRWNPDGWNVSIEKINIDKGLFRSDQQTERQPYASFDGQHIMFGNITGSFTGFRVVHDTIMAKVALKTKERSGFTVNSLSANMKWHPEAMEFSNLDLKTPRSHLTDYFAMRYASFYDMSDFISKVRMEGNFNDAIISSDDIAYFATELSDWKKRIQINGNVKGTVDNLNTKDIVIEAGADTYLKGNISMAGLPDINKTYIDFEAENFRTTYKDAVAFIPQLKNVSQPRLDVLEYLIFRGNFTGFINDFVTYGSLETKLGTVVTDLNMKLPDNDISRYSGSIKTNGFQLGTLIDNKSVGNIIFEGNVNGSGLRASTVNAELDGNIRLFEFNNYPYQSITVKGKVAKKLFNGELITQDPNLQANLNGLVDFSKDIPEFNFDANISRADLKKLNLLKDQVDFYGKFRFNFKGSNIDNFLGTARVYDASLLKSGKRISFDSLYLESKILDSNKVITAISNEFDAAIAGEFSINDLPAAFQTFLNKYYPSYIRPSKKVLINENFSFVITTKNVEEYIGLIDPKLKGFNYSTITGRINTKENLLDLNADVPQFNYSNLTFNDVKIKATGTYENLLLQGDIANVYINDSLNFPGTSFKLRSSNDISDFNIKTSANQTLNSAAISAKVQTLPGGARIKFQESNFDINGKNWIIEKNGEVLLTDSLITASGIKLYNGLQEIQLTSVPSNSGKGNDLRIQLQKVNIGDFTPYLIKSNRIEGLLTGTVNVSEPFKKIRIDLNAEAEQFRLDDDSIGKVALKGKYYGSLKEVNFNATALNPNYNFDLQGIYNLGDSTKTENLDIFTNLKNTRIDLLQRYLSGVFTEVTGLATGVLRITGPLKNLDYIGSVWLADAILRVRYTNVLYRIPNANIELKEDRIDFGTFMFEDEKKNRAQITKGILYHQGFDNLSFDFAMNTNKITVLNTTNTGNDPYYGNVIAKAKMTFTGPLEDMRMDIEGQPADSSSLFINTKTGKESGQADFVVWKVYGREMQTKKEFGSNNLTVNLDVTANNYANMYVILDELTGDIIQANGRGNLKIQASTNGEFYITGRYDIDRGNYNFNFESLLKKPFRLREGVGNYIQWTGDPANATIKVDAEYEAENVRFSDLGLQTSQSQLTINSNVLRSRGKVLVVATLTEQLLAPVIKFQIELPANSPLKNDVEAARILTLIQNDENELNKQVAFLVVFNSFGPLSTSGNQGTLANTAFEGIVVGSISGVLSNMLNRQFSSIFQKIFNDKSIRVNFNAQFYSGSNAFNDFNRNTFIPDRTNLNLSIGKSLFNERLTFTFGSAADFGITSAQSTNTRNLPFLPDITAEWRITPDGKLALTFFYRDTYNYTRLGARENRSGASISYRREFDHTGELWKKRNAQAERGKAQRAEGRSEMAEKK
ncbi:MAG TPA: translocation/assembly module TamB domain-containing protein [Flavitalea sp.]|nr:translocation/assembly module TamB domain-containing protein [Flavitalea sp.]